MNGQAKDAEHEAQVGSDALWQMLTEGPALFAGEEDPVERVCGYNIAKSLKAADVLKNSERRRAYKTELSRAAVQALSKGIFHFLRAAASSQSCRGLVARNRFAGSTRCHEGGLPRHLPLYLAFPQKVQLHPF